MPNPPSNLREFQSLVEIMKALRGPDGCPWDKEQTLKTLAPFAIEEAHELADAIASGDSDEICEELGDVLLQVALQSEVARQESLFTIEDVIESIAEKMVRRHPHVFGEVKVSGTADVMTNWNEIKKSEGKSSTVLDVPSGIPALMQSQKIGRRTEKAKFDWENVDQVLEQMESEIRELRQSLSMGQEEQKHELGDVLFSVVQVARHLDIDAEMALKECNQRFLKRYSRMQEIVGRKNLKWDDMDIPAKEAVWQEAKRELKNPNTKGK
ncbi:MAG: nucleoside triphosphate pyrophosphohydrolase [Bdellovibrionales bacterium]|nr:nucleoside triphosphate pyrophosphohydrolase [Bdellovibrionales bacterium]